MPHQFSNCVNTIEMLQRSIFTSWRGANGFVKCFSSSENPFRSHYGAFTGGLNTHSSSSDVKDSDSFFDVENPATGEILSQCLLTPPHMVTDAIQKAQDVFNSGEWSKKPVKDRSAILFEMASILKSHIPQLAEKESWQTGRPIREMKAQLGRLPEWFEYFGSLIRTFEGTVPPFFGNFVNYVNRVPLGVVSLITPWNHPLLIAIKKLAPALATGNSVILKPSELAPLSVLELGDMFKQAGLPDGVLSILPGDGSVGQSITTHPSIKKIDFTGGTKTGRVVGKMGGENLCHITSELGGKAPMIVFEDALTKQIQVPSSSNKGTEMISNFDNVVNGCAFGSFIASGQTCIMGSRILVQESVYPQFLKKLIAKISKITIGDPFLQTTQMGPVISQSSLTNIQNFVTNAKKEGATVSYGGNDFAIDHLSLPYSNGYFYPPTIISDVTPDMDVVRNEVFGPVVVVYPFKDEEEAIQLANDSPFGLAASIWTGDSKRGHRIAQRLNVGIIWINDHHKNDPSSPWGGMGESGIGRENGLEAFREYTQAKSVVTSYDDTPFDWFVTEDVRYS